MKFTDEEKLTLIDRYRSGTSVATLCTETGIARSTMYSWMKPNNQIVTEDNRKITIQDFNKAKRHEQKLGNMLDILKRSNCSMASPLQAKLASIESLYDQQYSVTELCEALDVPRGTFYNHILRNKRENTLNAQRRTELKPLIKEIFDSSNQIYGGEKIVAVLREQGHRVGKKLVLSIMQKMGLQSVCPQAKHEHGKWKKGENRNALHQDFHAEAPNKIWVSDVTTYKCHDCYYFICVVLDVYSRKIVGYKMAKQNSTQLLNSTFKQACSLRTPLPGLLFHSDRGRQYLSHSFEKVLKLAGATHSLSGPGKPHDNAVCEAFFSILKKEEIYRHKYRSIADMQRCIAEYIVFYNSKRLHSALQYKSPDTAEEIYWSSLSE